MRLDNYRSHPDEAQEMVEQIEGCGGHAPASRADVSSPEDVKELMGTTIEGFGRPDITVNNAGMGKRMPFLETPLEVRSKARVGAFETSLRCARTGPCRPTRRTARPKAA